MLSLPNHTIKQDILGVNFKPNSSLSTRYEKILNQADETDAATFHLVQSDCILIASKCDPLKVLGKLSQRHGFTRCAGKVLAASHLTDGMGNFFHLMESSLPENSKVRLHCYPAEITMQLLDKFDSSEALRNNKTQFCPVKPTHLLTVISMDNVNVHWGLYTEQEYRQYIARPGDGDRDYIHDVNFNKAQAKVAEAIQMLEADDFKQTFASSGCLVVDVGAAPGGWTQYLAQYCNKVSVIAIDPGELDPAVSRLSNVCHLRMKAENAVTTDIFNKDQMHQFQETKFPRSKNTTPEEPLSKKTDDQEVRNIDQMLNNCSLEGAEVQHNMNKLTKMNKDEKSVTGGSSGTGKKTEIEMDETSPLSRAGQLLCGPEWKDKYRLLVCDANLDVRDSVRDLVTPAAASLVTRGVAIVTLKLGRRVGEQGIKRKVSAVSELMKAAGFDPKSFEVHWLFSNSKNERTFIARKI